MIAGVAKIYRLLNRTQRRGAVVLLGLMSVGMVLETLGIGLVIPALALMTQGGDAARNPRLAPLSNALGDLSQTQLVTLAILALMVIMLAKNLFLAYLAWRQNHFAYGVQAQLSQRLYRIYLNQPYTFHLHRNSAHLLHNVTREVELFTHNGILSSLLLISEGLVVIGITALLISVEPLGASIVMVALGGASWFFHSATRRRLLNWGRRRLHHEGLRLQHLQQGLGGVKDVKLLGREGEFLEQYHTHSSQSARVGELQATLQQLPRLWIEMLAMAGLAGLVLVKQAQGEAMVSMIPSLGLFAAAAFRLMPSANRVIGAAQAIRYTLPGIDVLHAELALGGSTVAALSPTRVSNGLPLRSEIRLQGVSYAYPEAAGNAIASLDIIIRKGESVGFIGPSGSGKTTLVDLILGLLPPNRGKVTVDGLDVATDLRAWQDQLGYVPQTIFLTDDTLRRNVAFGLAPEQISDASVWRAVTAAQLNEFISTLPDGLDTVVGERGVRLSGGQRQRIGIARALYHNPTVLVLDEATSALDSATEAGVMDAVTALRGEKTILVVAHRLSTVDHCDRLYRLADGRLVAESAPAKPKQLVQHR